MKLPSVIQSPPFKQNYFRFGLILGVSLLLVLARTPRTQAAPAPQATPPPTPTPMCPPGEYWDPLMTRCWPLQRECPAGRDVRP